MKPFTHYERINNSVRHFKRIRIVIQSGDLAEEKEAGLC